MSEYIVEVPDEEAELFIARFGINGTTMFGYQLVDEIVRCRDCKYRYGCLHLVDNDDDVQQCDATPDGFCAWGVKREEDGE